MKKLKINKKITDSFKKNFENFTLWISTVYVMINVCKNLRNVIKSIKDINDTPTYLI